MDETGAEPSASVTNALFLIRGGAAAWWIATDAVAQHTKATDAAKVTSHFVTGEPDVVVCARGSTTSLEQLFLVIADHLAGAAVVAGQPVSVIPYALDAHCYKHPEADGTCFSGMNAGAMDSGARAFVEVDVVHASDHDQGILDPVAKAMAFQPDATVCVYRVTGRDRLFARVEVDSNSKLGNLLNTVRENPVVVGTRTRGELNPPLKRPAHVDTGSRGKTNEVDTFLFFATGRETAKEIVTALDDDGGTIVTGIVYGPTDLILRANGWPEPGTLLRIACGLLLPQGKGWGMPERLRVLRPIQAHANPNRVGKFMATVTIDVRGKDQGQLGDVIKSMLDSPACKIPLTYLGKVPKLNVIVAQVAFDKYEDRERWIAETVLGDKRGEKVRTTTTYIHHLRESTAEKNTNRDLTEKVHKMIAGGTKSVTVVCSSLPGYSAEAVRANVVRNYNVPNRGDKIGEPKKKSGPAPSGNRS